ncbi:MAG: dihydroneopterin aldolase [Gammaproteobacteria bacterium]|nr:dihydroneopterin aldolase [Gammaproteobacteria bacterium]
MIDRMYVSRLPLLSYVGVYLHEKEFPQPLYLDLELAVSLAEAAATDELENALDYSGLCRDIQAVASREHCNLIETRLTELLAIALWDPRVTEVRGRLYKPGAVPGAEISVERTLTRADLSAIPSAEP